MAIRNVIVRGRVGFAAGDVKYLFTHGLNIGEAVVVDNAMVCGEVLVNPLVRGRVKISPLVCGEVKVAECD